MGVTERVWSALTSMIKLEDKVTRQADALKTQQVKIEDLTSRVIRLEAQLEIQARRQLVERPERRGELRITGVADDTQPDRSSRLSHPAIASDSSIARTRSAIPSGVSPQIDS